MRGDMRALEIQANDPRTNPITGGSNGRMIGAGATPSMGLSQFRGGGECESSSSSDSESMRGGVINGWTDAEKAAGEEWLDAGGAGKWTQMSAFMAQRGFPKTPIQCRTWFNKMKIKGDRNTPHGVSGMNALLGMGGGSGGAHHRTSNSASRMNASHPTALGIRLRQHLHKLHGAGFLEAFKKGLSTAGTVAKYAAPFVLSPMAGTAVSAGLGAMGFGRHAHRGARGDSMEKHGGAMYPSGAYEGQGREREDEAFSGVMGRGGRRKRAPAGPNDGRRKRAEIVKRVMGEKGMSMIEASKYVKEHGLY